MYILYEKLHRLNVLSYSFLPHVGRLIFFCVCFSVQDGVVDPMDSTLRDFCGRCIEEFVKWSIKQTTPKQQEKSPTNMKSLFKRIYSLALHPNGFKRLGAALAFNSIYRLFRYDSFLSAWTLLFNFCSTYRSKLHLAFDIEDLTDFVNDSHSDNVLL